MENIKAGLKFRPLLANETEHQAKWTVDGQNITSTNKMYSFQFNGQIFGSTASNGLVYQTLVKPLVSRAVEGYNGLVFANGQSGSGKTHTLVGDGMEPGIIAFAIRELMSEIESSDAEFRLKVGYIEILDEVMYDLLDNRRRGLQIYEWEGNLMVNNREFSVDSEKEIKMFFSEGNRVRKASGVSAKNLKRSQTVFCISIRKDGVSHEKASNLFFVDLADSEQSIFTESASHRQTNNSFLSLQNVVKFLLRRKETPIKEPPSVRECKLMRILSPSIDENVSIALICTASPTSLDGTFRSICLAQRVNNCSIQLTVDIGPKPVGVFNRKRKLKFRRDRDSVKRRLLFEDNTELMFKEIKSKIAELEVKVESLKKLPTSEGFKAIIEKYEHEVVQETVRNRKFSKEIHCLLNAHDAAIKTVRSNCFSLSQKLAQATDQKTSSLTEITSQSMQQRNTQACVEKANSMQAIDESQNLIIHQRINAEIDKLKIEFEVEKHLQSIKRQQQEERLSQLKNDLQASKTHQESQRQEIKAMMDQIKWKNDDSMV